MAPLPAGASNGTMLSGFPGSGGALGLIEATSNARGAGDCAFSGGADAIARTVTAAANATLRMAILGPSATERRVSGAREILTGGSGSPPTAPQSSGESVRDRRDRNRRQHATARGLSRPGPADRERREPVRVYAAVRWPRVSPPGIQGPCVQRAWLPVQPVRLTGAWEQ